MCADWLTVAMEEEFLEGAGSQRGSGGIDDLSAVAHCGNVVGAHRCLRKEELEKEIEHITYIENQNQIFIKKILFR